jgi:hypothetical protein
MTSTPAGTLSGGRGNHASTLHNFVKAILNNA